MNLEGNKIFGALLAAGVTIWFGGFIAEQIMHPHALHEDAVAIAAAEASDGGGAAAAAGPEPILALIAAADVAKGEKLSKACGACHSFENGGGNKVGPNLWGIVGAKQAHMSGFEYSAGLAGLGGVWSYQNLNQFFWKPKAYVAGTKMNYAGLKKPQDRAALIAWLRTQSASPAALPTDAEIAAEAPPAEAAAGAVEGGVEGAADDKAADAKAAPNQDAAVKDKEAPKSH